MNPITTAREYRTRCGHPVKLFTVGARDPLYPIVGEVYACGQWENHTWTADGSFNPDRGRTSLDLIEVEPAMVEAGR